MVYCKNCKYLATEWVSSNVECHRKKETMYTPIESYDIFTSTTMDNDNNDCEYYKKRWYRRR